eukprot:2766779-Pyramimonas_sp.AAC.1
MPISGRGSTLRWTWTRSRRPRLQLTVPPETCWMARSRKPTSTATVMPTAGPRQVRSCTAPALWPGAGSSA